MPADDDLADDDVKQPRTEIRFELSVDDVAVLDGYCQGGGLDRATVMRRILREWSEQQLHVATLICRTTGRNPFQAERRLNAPGAAPERGAA